MEDIKNGFYVINGDKISTLDNWDEGEDPDTTQMYDFDLVNGSFFETLGELEEATEFDIHEHWMADDDGRLMYNQMEDGHGNVISGKHEKMKLFSEGAINLFSVTYIFYIKFVTGVHTPTAEEMSKKFKIEK